MNKKISLFLTALMLLNIFVLCPVTVVNAQETESFADYTLIDVAYSEPLNLFVAVGNKSSKGATFASSDGVKWAKVKDYTEQIAYGDSDCLVWWPIESKFIVYFKSGKISISSDGYNWTSETTTTGFYANGGITLDQDGYLIHFYKEFISVSQNLTEIATATAQKFTTYTGANGAQIYATGAISGGVGSAKTIYGVAGYRGGASYNNSSTWLDINAYAGTSTIKDWVYSSVQNCFYMATSSDGTGKVLGKISMAGDRSATDAVGFSGRINSINIGNGYMIAGSTLGKFYKTEDVSSAQLGSMVWTEITTSNAGYLPSLPRRFAYGNNKFVSLLGKSSSLATSKGQIAVFDDSLSKFDIVENYNKSPYSIVLEKQRYEVPEAGQATIVDYITPKFIDLNNNFVENADTVKTISTSALPNNISHSNGVLTMLPGSYSGSASVTVTSNNNITESFVITFVRESTITMDGYFDVVIPSLGDGYEEWAYTASIIGEDGVAMQRGASFSIIGNLPAGITFLPDSNAIRIADTALSCSFEIQAASNGNPVNKIVKTVTVTPRRPTSVEIKLGDASIVISDSVSLNKTYTAAVKDQTSRDMSFEKIVWSVVDSATGLPHSGVAIDQTGVLTVLNSAFRGDINVIATSKTDPSVFVVKKVTLSFTDLRCMLEDSANLKVADDLNAITEDLVLKTIGENGSIITWVSSNPAIVSVQGKVTPYTDLAETVTLTATIKKNSNTTTKIFELKVLKVQNILNNGNFEVSDLSKWKQVGTSSFAIGNGNANSGQSSLEISARSASTDGVSQSFAAKNNASYLFVAYVKGTTNGQTFAMATSENGEIASKSSNAQEYIKLSGIVNYSKHTATFSDNFLVYTKSGTENFYLDDVKLEEITIELNTLLMAIQKAESSKLQADIDAARLLLNSFYDTPEKGGYKKRLDDIIVPSTPSKPSGGGGGGGGATGGVATISVTQPTATVTDNSDKVYEHMLIFKDLSGHWAKDDIEYMAKLKIVNGKEEGVFAPDANITRAEFTVLAVRALGVEPKKYLNSFYDVVEDDWYSGYVETAKDMKLIGGSEGMFYPNKPITREEMTKIIVSAYNNKTNSKLVTGSALYYGDYYDISSWAYDYIVAGVNLKIVNGMTETTFAPKSNANRAQAVIMLKRMYDKINTKEEGGK